MKKILGFSLLLLALALIAGCGGDDKNNVSIDISPLSADIQTGEMVFLQVTAKNTSIIMPDPLDLPGSFRMVGTTGIQYTAPEDPPKVSDGFAAVPANDQVEINVCAAADKSKCAKATLNVLYKAPAGNVEPGNIIIFRGLSERAQFTATFSNVRIYGGEATGYSTPKYRIIPDRHVRCENDGPNGTERCILRDDTLGYFADDPDGRNGSYTGAFIHREDEGLNTVDIGTVEATLDLDPRVYGRDINGNIRQARATARVRVRPPSDRFQWITLLTGVGYGSTGNDAPVLSRPFFTEDKLTRSEDGQYIVYHSCQANTTTCSERLVRKDKGVKEPDLLTSRAGTLVNYPGNLAYPIKIREQPSAAPLKTEFTEAAKNAIPQGALNGIPSQHETAAGYGASHPSLTSMIKEDREDGYTIGIFEMSLNDWPPVARVFVARWPNNIPDTEPMWLGWDCTWAQITAQPTTCTEPASVTNSRLFEYENVLSRYSIVAFAGSSNNYGPGMLSKVAKQNPPKPPKDPLDEESPSSVAAWARYNEKLLQYGPNGEGANWALGYYDGNRMTVRGLVFTPDPATGRVRMRLRGTAIPWDPQDRYTREHSERTYLTDLVFEDLESDFIAVGVVGSLNPNDSYLNVTAWRYMTGLAMVKSENTSYNSDLRKFYGCDPDMENEDLLDKDPVHSVLDVCVEEDSAKWKWENVDIPAWEADTEKVADYNAWKNDPDPAKSPEPPAGTAPPVEPEEPEQYPLTFELLEEMLGLERFRIMYADRDPSDDCLILVGYGTDVETGAMTGFMAKSYDRGFKKAF